MQQVSFSMPYNDQTLAFIVEDHRRDEFSSRKAVQSLEAPRIGIPNVPYYVKKVREYLPQAEIVLLNSPREFLNKNEKNLDALVYSAEAGSAWSLLYPDYGVAIPHPDILKVPLAYPIARGDEEFVDYVNNWITLKTRDKTIERAYDHWILGKGAEKKAPRWSIIRNVLHWVE